MENRLDNNHVTVRGVISGKVVHSHNYEEAVFYATHVSVERKSHVPDKIPVMIPAYMMNGEWRKEGNVVEIWGQYRSHNCVVDGRLKVELGIYVREYRFIKKARDFEPENRVYLDGYLCRKPNYRITPSGKEIADLLIAVNRGYRKTDYVPCICWGKNARSIKKKTYGDRCRISGRIQSRSYTKRGADGKEYRCVAYEVSVNNMEFATRREENQQDS